MFSPHSVNSMLSGVKIMQQNLYDMSLTTLHTTLSSLLTLRFMKSSALLPVQPHVCLYLVASPTIVHKWNTYCVSGNLDLGNRFGCDISKAKTWKQTMMICHFNHFDSRLLEHCTWTHTLCHDDLKTNRKKWPFQPACTGLRFASVMFVHRPNQKLKRKLTPKSQGYVCSHLRIQFDRSIHKDNGLVPAIIQEAVFFSPHPIIFTDDTVLYV